MQGTLSSGKICGAHISANIFRKADGQKGKKEETRKEEGGGIHKIQVDIKPLSDLGSMVKMCTVTHSVKDWTLLPFSATQIM